MTVMCENRLSQDNINKIREICEKFGNNPSELINVLHKCQEHFGFLPKTVQVEIARALDTPLSRVYGVVTFYSFFTMEPKGKHPISICTGTACYVCGAERLVEEFERVLGIKLGKTTKDGKFSLDSIRCVGACGLAPVVMVGKKIYGRASVDSVKEILAEYKD